MLEYLNKINGDPYKLGFIDKYSHKELESIINHKLYEYEEIAYTDPSVEIDKIMVILELNPNDNELNDSDYIKNQKEQFINYYERILEDIHNSEFYDLGLL